MRTSPQAVVIVVGLTAALGYVGYVLLEGGDASPMAPLVPVSVSVIPRASFSPQPTTSVRLSSPPAVTTVLTAINAERERVGVSALVAKGELQYIAQEHAADMATRGYFSHTDPSGVTFEQRIVSSGVAGTAHAENIGLTSASGIAIVSRWMGSDGHRTNMLNSAYRTVGIGMANGVWQGQSVVFVVAVFGNK